MATEVVITGIGMVTPLGSSVSQVLTALGEGSNAVAPPSTFDAAPFACRLCCEIAEFAPEDYVRDPKSVRLMNREALLAAAAAKFAVEDAELEVGTDYAPERVGLFGATGLAGLPFEEAAPLVRRSADGQGRFDPRLFATVALKETRPTLSFKILSNMPICFISVFENIQGPNCIFNPWEGQGALAIVEGLRALQRGEADCCLVGGCDYKTHLLGFIALHQQGVFDSWEQRGAGCIPGEGATFLVLETQGQAAQRGVKRYARIAGYGFSRARGSGDEVAYRRAMAEAMPDRPSRVQLVSAADGTPELERAENAALQALKMEVSRSLSAKKQLGSLFAAAAATQMGLGAAITHERGGTKDSNTLVNCFGPGSEQASFLLEAV